MNPKRSPFAVVDDDLCPAGTLPRIAGLEVADSSFGLWLAAGGERRRAAEPNRSAWTPEERAQRQQRGGSDRDAMRLSALKR